MIGVFGLAFVWSWLATREIAAISAGKPEQAALWCAANSAFNFVLTFTIALSLVFLFIFPYVLGCVVATYAATSRKRSA